MTTPADSTRLLAERLGIPESELRQVLVEEQLVLLAEAPLETGQQTTVHDSHHTIALESTPPPDEAGSVKEAPPPPPPIALPSERYRDLGQLGIGGMGEVRRVYDRQLRRVVAMKSILPAHRKRAAVVARFVEEAEVTAQLQHPGIIPIHDRGVLPDGRVWFTMREVGGKTFFEAIRAHHRDPPDRGGFVTRRRRLLETLRQVCAAVAHAHDKGVVHRDLKPENVMLGEQGDILVVDWGLARVGRAEATETIESTEPTVVDSSRTAGSAYLTQMGQVAGTPAYMSPEQANGAIDQIGPTSDVYSLGICLYVILVGRTPYVGKSRAEVLRQARKGVPEARFDELRTPDAERSWSTRTAASSEVPAGLVDICQRALCVAPSDRYPSASELGEALQGWLDGAQQRSEAEQLVQRARLQTSRIEALQEEAQRLRSAARLGLAALPPWASVDEKRFYWDMEEQAGRTDSQASLLALEKEMLLHSALTRVANLTTAHAELATLYRQVHVQTERRRQSTTRVEALLRRHSLALPRHHADRQAHLNYLDGRGTLTLRSDPPGATVRLYRYVTEDRKLVRQDAGILGTTPLEQPLEAGSYVCVLTHPGFAPTQYPVQITREGHWAGIPPDSQASEPVRLLPADAIGAWTRYVPAGPMRLGIHHGVPAQLVDTPIWVDGFAIQATPVTNAAYLEFLNDPAVDGLRWAPRERDNPRGEPGSLLVAHIDGRFELSIDPDGDRWTPHMPVVYVSYAAAQAYARWLSRQTGYSWRLPTELEWRKACQGVDGRPFPWGWDPEPTRAQCLHSGPPRQILTDVATFPDDRSPYGVHDMAGNCNEWTLDRDIDFRDRIAHGRARIPEYEDGASRLVCGVSWLQSLESQLQSAPQVQPITGRSGALGFRLVREV